MRINSLKETTTMSRLNSCV